MSGADGVQDVRADQRAGEVEENLGEERRVVTGASRWLDVRCAMTVDDRREGRLDSRDDLVRVETVRELDSNEVTGSLEGTTEE